MLTKESDTKRVLLKLKELSNWDKPLPKGKGRGIAQWHYLGRGKVEQSNFHDNPVLRINEMPLIEVHILAEGGSKIKGVGEPGLPPFAPALGNAIFAATGKRVRKLPIDLSRIG